MQNRQSSINLFKHLFFSGVYGQGFTYFTMAWRDYGDFTDTSINKKFYRWMSMKRDYIEIALTALTIILALFAIFLALWKLLGNSPTVEQLSLGVVTAIGSWLIILTYKLGRIEEKTTHLEKNMKDSFDRVREDLKEIKQKLK